MEDEIWIAILTTIISSAITGLIPGYLSKHLHTLKGYSPQSGFWIGYLFGLMGLIYAAGLPNLAVSKVITNDEGETIIMNSSSLIEEDEEQQFSDWEEEKVILGEDKNVQICPVCGWQIFPEEDCCSNCGSKKIK